MILSQLLPGAHILQHQGDLNLDVRSLAYDSRQTQPDCLFFAMQGERLDGHTFVEEVISNGAVGVVSERPPPPDFRAAWVQVAKIRHALAEMSRTFYGCPDLNLKLVGITGTNGKTTTAYLLQSIFEASGLSTGLFGTIEYRAGDRVIPAHHTTPESLDLAGYFAEVVKAGGKAAVLEISSHALAQDRVWGLRFAAAVFTNLTRDHLDYHKDFKSYFAAKRKLFEGVGAPPPELGVINLDDPWGARLLQLPQPRQITYGIDSKAQVKVRHFSLGPEGIRAALVTGDGELEIESRLLGRANLENILAAVAAAQGLAISKEAIRQGVASLTQVPGRFERIDEGQPFVVVVDYAHTPDALRNALKVARELTRHRLIVVFGCGGERDRTKRPMMGQVAGQWSDWVVLTSDNPRSENPMLIINDVMVGLQKSGKPYLVEADREEAIRRALGQARAGDVVLLAGKGHETYQVLKDRTIALDDREVARRVLRTMGFAHP